MEKNIKLFIGLLAMSAFLGACGSLANQYVKVSSIPPSYFEENRGEGERLVYVTVEKAADVTTMGGSTTLYIVTNDEAIKNLTVPYTSVGAVNKMSPSIQNAINIFRGGDLAVFSLPKSQENIGFSYFCSIPDESKNVATGAQGVSVNTAIIYTMGYRTFTIDPEAGDIAIRVILRPSGDESSQILTTTNSNTIAQMVSERNYYATPAPDKTDSPGFIPPPEKEKK